MTGLLKIVFLRSGCQSYAFIRSFTILFSFLVFLFNTSVAQQPAVPNPKTVFTTKNKNSSNPDLFGTNSRFIENIGQYGETMPGYTQLGKIKFGYEGLNMPVLFTSKGLIHLQRKSEKLSHKEEEELEKAGVKEEEIEHKRNITDRTITMEWIGINENAEIIAEEKTTNYYTYGLLTQKAYGYKKIIYKNAYPGIDIVYSFTNINKLGFEYSLVAAPGADLSVVHLKYGGDVKSIKTDSKGSLVVNSDIDGISTTIPVSYYGEKLSGRLTGDVKASYKILNNEISFTFPEGYDTTKAIVIDPFVSGTSNLTGTFAGKAIDVDFDYAGNVYVAGGGVTNQLGTASHSYAKYNSAGVLQWTFNGILTLPPWQALYYYGGWVVDKASGALYMGQGFSFPGFRVIRISTTGLYDNYISTSNANFQEDWKMYWYCNNGNPQIICAGGGTTANNNIAICAPPSTALVSSANLTGAAAAYQDMSDLVIDPVTNSLYSIYASGLDKTIENKIFKHNAPYSAATSVWSTQSGYVVLGEILNRPYLGGSYADNSSNILAVNANYLFYWDGVNLKAFDKATGVAVGTPLAIAGNLRLMQGGVVADACNNVFIGNTNGIIKVYKFNGTTFDDAAANDITVTGYNTNVYDLALDESKKLLYASGDGFVGSFDVSAYCPTTQYTVNVVPNCVTASATATISPVPPTGSTVTYTLFIGATQIASNTTGIFTGLNPNIIYTIVATVNLACSGTQASTTFILPGPTITFTKTNTTCGASTGSIIATGSGTPGPYSYSLNGGAFQPSGTFTGLAAGIYKLVVQGAGGCPNDTTITILNSNGPTLTYTQTNADCGNNTGTVTANATGGTPPYQYSINGGTTYQSSNFFTGLLPGTYTLIVRDAALCTNAAIIIITSTPQPSITAVPAGATCGNNNGTITAFGSGGTGALLYSINGNTFQPGNVFTNLTPGSYTVTVKDANGCTNTITVTVSNFPAPTVTAVSTQAACNNVNGTITATGNGGLGPLQYSINGITFQISNVFAGLAAGTYTITVKDASNCTGTATVTITSIGAPTVTATSTVSACNTNTGTITAVAIGGTPGYQYSLNNITYQASGSFTALAAGNYVVFVKDALGCIGTVSIVVGNTAGPSITATVTPTSCSGNTGTITATGTGGTPPLQYSIDGVTYGAGNIFTNLAAGVYTVYVKDANGCIKTTAVTVTNASNLTLAVSVINSSCGINNGTITATATGGVGGLQYSINGTVYQASNIFTSVAAGPYIVYVKDANNCIVTKNVVVTNATTLGLSLSLPQQATCGTASGVIIATSSGGVAPLTYNIDGGVFSTINVFVNVAPGVHTVLVKDANGCTVPQSATITNSGAGTAPTNITFVVNDVLVCTGEGRIKNLKGIPNGGGNTYTFSLDGGVFTIANQFRPVSIGVHVITAKNQFGCTVSRIAIVGLGTPATATATTTLATCGNADGTITIVGVGANVPYHASLDGAAYIDFFPPGINSFTFTGLTPGPHTITMADDADFTDAANPGVCLTTINVIVPASNGPSVTTTVINSTCGGNNGSITATGTGGTPPYQYNINGGAFSATNLFNNLSPGTYAIGVKDNSGSNCIGGTTVTIANQAGPTLTAVVLPTSCSLNNGTVTATATGGVAPLEYSINGTVYVSTNIFTGLTPGSYTLYVRDSNHCFSSLPVTIANTPLPFVTAFTIAASCNNNDGSIVATGTLGTAPYTFSIDGTVYQSSGTFSNLAAGFYTIYIKDDRGCITTTGVSVDNTSGLSITNSTTVSAKCGTATGSITVTATGGVAPLQYSNGGAFQASNIFPNLLPGNYIIIVKDANGCLTTKLVAVGNILGPQTLAAVIIDAACGQNNGTITATASGGTALLQYSRDGVTYQASNIFINVPAGSYTLYVKDANGCIKTLPVTVANLAGPSLSLSTSPASCGVSDGTITAIAIGGTLPLTYSKDGITFQSSNIFLNLAAGPYTITVKDARGCTATFNITVTTIGAVIAPTFNAIAPICSGGTLLPLPTTSLNGIIGTWVPALNNTATTTYTFTPAAGQCATTITLTITVNPKPSPIIIYHN